MGVCSLHKITYRANGAYLCKHWALSLVQRPAPVSGSLQLSEVPSLKEIAGSRLACEYQPVLYTQEDAVMR